MEDEDEVVGGDIVEEISDSTLNRRRPKCECACDGECGGGCSARARASDERAGREGGSEACLPIVSLTHSEVGKSLV